MPVVPQVDIHSTSAFSYKQQKVDTQQDWDNQGTHSRVVSHSSSGRPPHIKHLKRPLIEVGDVFQRSGEIVCEQLGDHIESHETDTHIESALESLTEFHSDAQTDNGKQDWHHDRSAQTDNIGKNLFHKDS